MAARPSALIFSSYYWPEHSGNAPYVTGLAEHLATRGHDVTVSTGFPHYPSWAVEGMTFARTEERDGVRICRRAHRVPKRQSAAQRGLYEASLVAAGVTTLPLRRPSLVVAVVPTLAAGALGALASAYTRARFAVIFQDVQGRAAVQSGVSGGERVARVVASAELSVARRADVVGIVAESFRSFFEAGGVPADTIHRVRNWSNFVEPAESVAETRARLGWGQTDFVCLHAGNMGHKQGLENVISAARRTKNGSVRFVLAGDGNRRSALEEMARAQGVGNVQFLDMQPMGGPCEAMCRAADVLLVNQRGSVIDMSLPSKLTTYFSAGRPVIAAVSQGGETAAEIRASGAGLVVAPDEPDSLADAVAEAACDRVALADLGRAGRTYAARVLSREAALSHIESLLVPGGGAKAAPPAEAKDQPLWEAG